MATAAAALRHHIFRPPSSHSLPFSSSSLGPPHCLHQCLLAAAPVFLTSSTHFLPPPTPSLLPLALLHRVRRPLSTSSSSPSTSPPPLHHPSQYEDEDEDEDEGEGEEEGAVASELDPDDDNVDEDDEESESPTSLSQVALPSYPSPKLSVKEKKELAAYAHSLGKKLKCQQVGKSGVTASVAASFVENLESNELLKLKVHGSCPGELTDVIKQLEEATGSVAVSQIGRSVILYRPSLSKMKEKDAQSARRNLKVIHKNPSYHGLKIEKRGSAVERFASHRSSRGRSHV